MFSVITPTYNRAHTLHRVYESLQKQTDKDFHWIVVDDASTDDTADLIKKFIKDTSDFEISYHRMKNNMGKPDALNYGFQYCKEPITIIADSDDSFVENTIADLKTIWNLVDSNENGERIATVWTLVEDEHNNIVGEHFPYDFWQTNLKDRLLRKNGAIMGEKWHSWRTEILRNTKMFTCKGSYVGESATWHKINLEYDFLALNIVHRKYYKSLDGYIQSTKPLKKTALTHIYTGYYQLRDVSFIRILKYKYYRDLAFEYLKYKIRLKKNEKWLGLFRELAALLASSIVSLEKLLRL